MIIFHNINNFNPNETIKNKLIKLLQFKAQVNVCVLIFHLKLQEKS